MSIWVTRPGAVIRNWGPLKTGHNRQQAQRAARLLKIILQGKQNIAYDERFFLCAEIQNGSTFK
jgi:hypothetical protein